MATNELLIADATVKAVAALLDLVAEYRPGKALPTVLSFQKAWVILYPSVVSNPAVRRPPSGRISSSGLPDGLYGRLTGRAMSTFILGIAGKLNASIEWDSQINDRVLPLRAADLPMWGIKNRSAIEAMRIWLVEIRNKPAPAPQPVTPITPQTPPPAPVMPPVIPSQPAPLPAPAPRPAPRPTGPDPKILQAIAKNVRDKCTPGFPNVFRHASKGNLIWVKDAVVGAFRRDPVWDFMKQQYSCGPVILLTPDKGDNTRILAGVGLAIAGVGSLFWLRKKKKKRK